MEPVTLNIGGLILTIKAIKRNKVFDCKCDTFGCDLKRKLSITSTPTSLTMTEVEINARNTSGQIWSIDPRPWKLIDTLGFAFAGSGLCNALRPVRTAEVGTSRVIPGTQVDFILVFPELDKGREVASLVATSGSGHTYTFSITPLTPEAAELLRVTDEASTKGPKRDNALGQAVRALDALDVAIQSRLHDVLSPSEAARLENDVRRLSLRFEQRLRTLDENRRGQTEPRFRQLLSTYGAQLETEKGREAERKRLDQTVERLQDLSPREFEQYTAELLQALGYEKVTLGPGSNDKGIDIFVERHGVRIAVQCKRWKGLVGSPDIQTFLGAMQHAHAHKGMFVTTGMFSVEAEKMASSHPLELVDGVGLGRLINKALCRPDDGGERSSQKKPEPPSLFE